MSAGGRGRPPFNQSLSMDIGLALDGPPRCLPPNESRAFFHKKLLGFAKRAFKPLVTTFVPGAAAVGALIGTVSGQRKEAEKSAGRSVKFDDLVTDMRFRGGATFPAGRRIVGGGPCPQTAPCTWPMRWDTVTCRCKVFLGDVSGPDPDPRPRPNGATPHPAMVPAGGAAAVGGAPVPPVEPFTFTDTSTRDGVRRRCPRRYKLGIDNLCYFNLPRNSKFRKWRPGRKPLFTGGDLNAIKTAQGLREDAEQIFKDTNPAKKAVARNYRANWRKPLKK